MRYALPFLFASFLWSQQTSTTPDITQSSSFITCSSTAGTTITVPDNTPVLFWRLTFYTDGVNFTAASVQIQGAPDNGGVAGTFTTVGFSVIDGANPIASAAQGTVAVRGYFKFIRAQCVSATGSGGTIPFALLGYRGTNPAASAAGGASSNVNVAQYGGNNVISAGTNGAFAVGGCVASGGTPTCNPTLIAGFDGTNQDDVRTDTSGQLVPSGVSTAMADAVSNTGVIPQAGNAGTPAVAAYRDFPLDFNGATWDRHFVCTTSVQVALSGTAYTQIIAGSNVLRICKVFVTSVSGGNPVVNTFNIAFGTCAGAPTQIFTAGGVTGFDEDFGGALRSGSGQALCVKESVANADLVTVTYTPGY